MWQIPTSMFIEQNSIVFDRDQLEPNLFKSIHNQFAQIVDSLINAYCEDAKITPKDLVDALKSVDKSKKLTFKERVLLEPVVAAQDFNVFVPMMMRKNVELQLQALKLMQHVTGMIPTAMTLAEEDAAIWDMLQEEDECERFILISVIRKSREDYANGGAHYWGELDTNMKERTEEEEEILKSIQEHHQQGIDDAIIKNLETGLQSLILKNGPETSTSEKARPSESSVSSVRPKTPSKEKDKPERLPTASSSKTQQKEKPMTADPRSTRSSSLSRPGTTKKATSSSSQAPPNPSITITGVPEKPPTRMEERRKTIDGGKTVLIPGHSSKRELGAIDASEMSLSGGKSGGGKKNPSNPAISPTGPFDYRSLLKERNQVSDEQIKARATYLRQQRDKLLELKRTEQQKHLKEQAEKEAFERPKTAQAARAALSQSESKLQARKAIASKLKAEVVDAAGSKNHGRLSVHNKNLKMQRYLSVVVAIAIGLEPVLCCFGGLSSGGKNPDGSIDDNAFTTDPYFEMKYSPPVEWTASVTPPVAGAASPVPTQPTDIDKATKNTNSTVYLNLVKALFSKNVQVTSDTVYDFSDIKGTSIDLILPAGINDNDIKSAGVVIGNTVALKCEVVNVCDTPYILTQTFQIKDGPLLSGRQWKDVANALQFGLQSEGVQFHDFIIVTD
ncbi:hypothetical protein FO519_006747 [Halicephalobus sp. NKZ332]|nr:hypothetical protein FO519_006747 [Halicephalobus sp. NKZ332]